MQSLMRALVVIAVTLLPTVALADDPPVLGYWTNIQMAGPNNPYASFEILLTNNGTFLERIIVNPGGVATYAGTWSFEADTSTLTYLITQWTPVNIPPPAANHNVAVHVDFTNGGNTMIMDQPGGVPIQWTKQPLPGGANALPAAPH